MTYCLGILLPRGLVTTVGERITKWQARRRQAAAGPAAEGAQPDPGPGTLDRLGADQRPRGGVR